MEWKYFSGSIFKQEICSIELTFENEADTIRDTLTIAQPKIYEGTLVADFENGIPQMLCITNFQ